MMSGALGNCTIGKSLGHPSWVRCLNPRHNRAGSHVAVGGCMSHLAAVGRGCDLTAACLLEVGRQGRVGGAGDGQADAPADDRGALSCLRVGQVGEFAVGETGDGELR
jgi:hypothetical protein